MKLKFVIYSTCVSFIAAKATQKQEKPETRQEKLYDHMDGGVLDKEEVKKFENMDEAEKKDRLLLICGKIDTNANGKITKDELQKWMQKTSHHYLQNDVNDQFPNHDKNNNGIISWSEYYESVFGMLKPEDFGEQSLTMDEMVARDKRRFETADVDQSMGLDKQEYGSFLHPEDFDHMKMITVQETLEDLDTNKDGKIDVDEYINDMYHPTIKPDEEPDWIKEERTHFKKIRDSDGDGYMDLNEVKNWLMPQEYDHTEAEAEHLIIECDEDENGYLSYDEILKKYDSFMTSQATNWGEALEYHDEL